MQGLKIRNGEKNVANILIIGGGVSGLSAGIYARLHGHRATVCERHIVPGGNLTGWNRSGYHIDNCIHWLTGTNPNTSTYKMWEELGALGGVEVYQGNSLYTCELDGRTVSLYSDIRKMEKEMLDISPEDKKEIRSLVRTVEALMGLFGIGGKEHDERLSIVGMLRAVPSLVKYYKLTTGELAEKFSHPLLRSFVISFLGEDFGSLTLLFVMAHYCGANGGIPMEGSFAMAERMADRLKALGGELLLGKEAVRINHENGRAESVTFADGTTRAADYVIVTGDPAVIFDRLLDIPMPIQLQKKYDDKRFKRFSSYQCAFAVDLEDLPFEGDFIYETPEGLRDKTSIKQVIIREFSHGSFAPKGKRIIQTMTFCSEETAESFISLRNKNKSAYDRKKKSIADILRRLIEERFPEMKGRLCCLDIWTPATYKRFTASKVGSWMSFTLPSRAIPLRVSNRVDGIDNVILASQWQQIPGGLPIAAEGGKLAVETISAIEKKAL